MKKLVLVGEEEGSQRAATQETIQPEYNHPNTQPINHFFPLTTAPYGLRNAQGGCDKSFPPLQNFGSPPALLHLAKSRHLPFHLSIGIC